MSMTIEIAGDLETLLKAEAGKAGVAPEEYTRLLLRRSLLKRQPNAPVLSREEAQLLHSINHGLGSEEMDRYMDLIRKRQGETITASEFDELHRLTQRLEEIGARRAGNLVRLAALRGIPVEEL